MSFSRNRNEGVQKAAVQAQDERINNKIAASKAEPLKSILKSSNAKGSSSPISIVRKSQIAPSPPLSKPSRGIRDRLAADDAEIAALEKALGIKDTKKLPKSFEGDGLDTLLEGLSDTSADTPSVMRKRKRSVEDQWLENKRQKAQTAHLTPTQHAANAEFESEAGLSNDEETAYESSLDMSVASERSSSKDESFADFSDSTASSEPVTRRVRENPYVAPAGASDVAAPKKYILPASRDKALPPSGDLSRLRRQMQGLLNRLSEANLLALVKDFEALYRLNPRSDMTSTLLDLLLELLADPTILQDTFIILHAGFIAALYKVVGSDVGAHAVSRINEEFEMLYQPKTKPDVSGKKLANLVNLLAHLYNFRVVGSVLIYDLIRIFIEDLSEINTELLLKITRSG